jgi:hypothetical protein
VRAEELGLHIDIRHMEENFLPSALKGGVDD